MFQNLVNVGSQTAEIT